MSEGAVGGTVKVLSWVLVRHSRRGILLGYKKRGFGSGKWNGFGGKLDVELDDNCVRKCAQRETREESCLVLEPLSRFSEIGRLEFSYDTLVGRRLKVGVFEVWITDEEVRQIAETEEMRPEWFETPSLLPLKKMWPDCEIWLLDWLNERMNTVFEASFRIRNHEGMLQKKDILEQTLSWVSREARMAA